MIRYYPQMLKLCPGVDEPCFWDLIEMAPALLKASKLNRSKALYQWARVSMQNDERGKKNYTELHAKGHSHGRALRGMSDRLPVRVNDLETLFWGDYGVF